MLTLFIGETICMIAMVVVTMGGIGTKTTADIGKGLTLGLTVASLLPICLILKRTKMLKQLQKIVKRKDDK